MALKDALQPPLPAAIPVIERITWNALQVIVGEGKSACGAICVALQSYEKALVASVSLRTWVLAEQNFHFCCV